MTSYISIDGTYRNYEERAALINAMTRFYQISFADAEEFVDKNSKFDWMKRDLEHAKKIKNLQNNASYYVDLDDDLRKLEWRKRYEREYTE